MAELEELYASAPREQEYVRYGGVEIKRLLCRTASKRYRTAVKRYLGELLVRRIEGAQSPAEALAPPSQRAGQRDGEAGGIPGEGEWVDLLGLLAPRGRVEMLCDAIERGEVDKLDDLQRELQALCDAYRDYEWAWAQGAWKEWSGKTPAEMSAEELAEAVRDWEDAALKLNTMVLEDARKEFGPTSRIGYGIDGDEQVQRRDFQAVRGEFEADEFVKTLREESGTIRERARAVLDVLGEADRP
jgi:hypothetical protein